MKDTEFGEYRNITDMPFKFKVIQGHRFLYRSTGASIPPQRPWCIPPKMAECAPPIFDYNAP